MEYYFERYGDLELQRRMVSDERRTGAFATAIRKSVVPGDLVLDIGTGTGILAMLAARAGAKHVHAVDAAPIAEVAAAMVKANGLSELVTVHQCVTSDLHLEQPVDLIISEWLGNLAIVEDMLSDVLDTRDRLLAKGGRMLPSRVRVMLAPIDNPEFFFQEGPGFWQRPVHGIDFAPLEAWELRQGRAVQVNNIEPSTLLAKGACLVELDLATMQKGDEWGSGEIDFDITYPGMLRGFAGWFKALLSPHVTLDTSPFEPPTHWGQTYFPFAPQPLSAGTILQVRYDMQPSPVRAGCVEITLESGGVRQAFTVE